jgi:BirA family biotin operon repressor/biotin-[acetyl-CoA-carboxylase] ligase
MDQSSLEKLLSGLPLGGVRYFTTIGSTNDLAARWAAAGAPDLSLVVADEQTAGRGRMGRRWLTPPGAALAFSLVLSSSSLVLSPSGLGLSFPELLPRLTALGALAICDTLNAALPAMLPAQIKWPNDVLASRRKLAGVLAEAHWHGDQLQAVILGIGINVAPDSVPPAEMLDFPATCLEAVLESSVDRWELLRAVLTRLLEWRQRLDSPDLVKAWERRLAFRGEWVRLLQEGAPELEGQVLGLNPDGALRLRLRSGEIAAFSAGEIRLRPANQGPDLPAQGI